MFVNNDKRKNPAEILDQLRVNMETLSLKWNSFPPDVENGSAQLELFLLFNNDHRPFNKKKTRGQA
jgi:hypothetical protein